MEVTHILMDVFLKCSNANLTIMEQEVKYQAI